MVVLTVNMVFILISLSPEVPQICRFPNEVGPCRALLRKYFFNMTSMQCELFYYGGCLGNSNRFGDLASCEEYCSPQKCQRRPSVTVCFYRRLYLDPSLFFFFGVPTALPVLCLDPLDKGKCSASIPRYYYNAATKRCEEFAYSGCGGSSNNFVSRQSCKDVCVRGV